MIFSGLVILLMVGIIAFTIWAYLADDMPLLAAGLFILVPVVMILAIGGILACFLAQHPAQAGGLFEACSFPLQ